MAISYIAGKRFKRALIAGADWLAYKKMHLNKLNVFPVPDGDTGTNMSLTLSSAINEIEGLQDLSLKEVANALTWGSLMGARGNSGVILAQIFAGFAESIGDKPRIYPQDIASALQIAARKAYEAVIDPVEGTMLTVVRETAERASKIVESETDIVKLLEEMLYQARISLENTPQLLPILKEAGVVDAGGLGFVYLLEGMLKLIRGEELERVEMEDVIQHQEVPASGVRYEGTNQYCTEFILEGQEIPQDKIRDKLTQIGDSVLMVAHGNLLRVHIHTSDPEKLFHYISSFGNLSQIKVDDMVRQYRSLLSTTPKSISIIAVALGGGLRKIFTNLGADKVIEGRQTMNPTVKELFQAIEEVPSSKVIMLPNNSNVFPTASQATKLTTKEVDVVISKSIPEGLAALIAFREDASFDENLRYMKDALREIKTGEVACACRATKYKDMQIVEGDILGIFNGEIKIVGKSANETVITLLEQMVDEDDELITIFYGEEVSQEDADALAVRLEEKFSHREIETHYGGQPYSLYIISVE